MNNNIELFSFLEDNLSESAILSELLKAKVAAEIIKSRVEKGLSQKELAKHMNVSQVMVSKWESGDCNFSLSTICDICEKLGLVFDIQITRAEQYSIHQDCEDWTIESDPKLILGTKKKSVIDELRRLPTAG